MRHFLFTALLLTACADEHLEQGFPNFIGSITIDKSAFNYEKGIMDAADLLEMETGMFLHKREILVQAQLHPILCTDSYVSGCSTNIGGTLKSKIVIQVDGQNGCIAETAIVHEFAHIARYIETAGDADGEHKDKEFWGTVGRAERKLLNKYCPRAW